MDTSTQKARILRHLKSGRPLTAIQALERFGCFRLAARINDLRREGVKIADRWVRAGGKHVKQYRI